MVGIEIQKPEETRIMSEKPILFGHLLGSVKTHRGIIPGSAIYLMYPPKYVSLTCADPCRAYFNLCVTCESDQYTVSFLHQKAGFLSNAYTFRPVRNPCQMLKFQCLLINSIIEARVYFLISETAALFPSLLKTVDTI
jgi:hypothetical protein